MPKRPRGTRDFGPGEAARRHQLEQTLRMTFEGHGYQEVQTPTFEELDLFTAKGGEAIVSELYDFTDKGDRRMALRPELTAPVMRMVFQDHSHDPKPMKWYYFGNCFRYDRPQTGRYREFWQFGCEQIGAEGPLAMAELIATGDKVLRSSGIEGLDLRVGHVGLLGQLVDSLGLDADGRSALMRAIDKGDDAGVKQACSAGDSEAAAALHSALSCTSVDDAVELLGENDALGELAQIFAHLQDFQVDARLHLGIARGLDYYNGVVFETHATSLGAQSQLLGGGAYDLSTVFKAKSIPTMGFGLGFDRTIVALDEEGAKPGTPLGVHVYFGAMSEGAQGVVTRGVTKLRRQGVRVDMDLMGRKPNQIAKAADAAGARFLIILGDRDLEAGTCSAKDLATGDETEVPIGAFEGWLLEQIGFTNPQDFD